MRNTIEELHLAAQYLSAAAISFIEKKDDDSHTNLAWSSVKKRMETHFFGDKCQLSLNLKTAHLEWLKEGKVTASTDLQDRRHAQNLSWIKKQAAANGITEDFKYEFHYDLPYKKLEFNHTFKFLEGDLKQISDNLSLGKKAFKAFIKEAKVKGESRIWPHHFDLGFYGPLNKEANVLMGAGLAIPDDLENDFYFYASGYKDEKPITTKDLKGLTKGEFKTNWNGATLSAKGISVDEVGKFLTESSDTYLKA
jgi:hypothetical protein